MGPLKSARAFLTLRLDGHGRASILSLYALACSLTQLLTTRVQMAMLQDANGRLSEAALETFVQEAIPRLARLKEHVHLQAGHSFLPFYVAHCVRKFCVLLEAKDKRGVPVESLLLSKELADLYALAEEVSPPLSQPAPAPCPSQPPARSHPASPPLCSTQTPATEDDDDGTPDVSSDENNWFSLAAAIRIYRQFLELDTDGDGMLTSDEVRGPPPRPPTDDPPTPRRSRTPPQPHTAAASARRLPHLRSACSS